MVDKAAFSFQLQGYPVANRDAVVTLTHEATGTTIERKPFLDGSLLVRDLEPGFYEMTVSHPNLVTPIDKRRIRLFPQPAPTQVNIPVPADLFKDTPIRDIPDADLGPVQKATSDVKTRLSPIGTKASGEVIRAADWNLLVGAVQDLAGAVLQLTNLVSPRGHDHPEIADKIAEVQDNLRAFAEAYGRSLLQLQREIETESLRKNATDVLTAAGASPEVRASVLDRVDELHALIQSDTTHFTQKLSNAGSLILSTVNDLAVAQGANADAFMAKPEVKALTDSARQYTDTGVQTKPESELKTYERTTTVSGGKLTNVVRR